MVSPVSFQWLRCRAASLARRGGRRVVGARAPNSGGPRLRTKKTACGAIHPAGCEAWRMDLQARRGPEGSTRSAPRTRRQRVRRRAVLVRGSCQRLRQWQTENKRPGGLRPTGSLGTQEAEPPEWKALGSRFDACKARRIRRGSAADEGVLRDQEVRHRSLVRPAAGSSAGVATIRRHGD